MTEEHQYPSLSEQGKNLVKFSFDLIKNALQSGALMVSTEIKTQRLEICKSCEWYDDNNEQSKCKKCGCFVIPKVSFALDSCPENKWKESQDGWNERFDEIMKKTEEDTITNSAK